jgi:dihydroneopterin aldolase
MGKIVIDGLRELGVHGVLPEEQTRPQPFEVDVELTVDLTVAGETDALDDTVDYAAVAEAISRVVRSERYQLLERLATRIAEVCRVDERVTSVAVTVRKLHPPVRAMVDHVAVHIVA